MKEHPMPASLFRSRSRRGLSLIELLVVLVILVGLAGLVIPMLPGMVGRSQQAAAATDMSEITKWVQAYETSTGQYPKDWDALTDGSATALTYLSSSANKDVFSGASPPVQMTALTAGQASPLTKAGITQVQLMSTAQPSGTSLTFNPYANTNKTTNGLAIASGVNVVTLTLAGQQQLRLGDGTTNYGTFVVFGFGDRASLVKASNAPGVQDAPVVNYDAFTPDVKYSRYGVVFQIEGLNSSGTFYTFNRARFVCPCKLAQQLSTTNDAIKGYWDDVTASNGS
jgi:prepilin-type N-terminal cleavage/methylation domain-containing protein